MHLSCNSNSNSNRNSNDNYNNLNVCTYTKSAHLTCILQVAHTQRVLNQTETEFTYFLESNLKYTC